MILTVWVVFFIVNSLFADSVPLIDIVVFIGLIIAPKTLIHILLNSSASFCVKNECT